MYALATLIGSVMGGIQALSRSTYAKLIPEDSQAYASYFNVYDVVEKLSIVTGTAMYGLIKQFAPEVRTSFLVLAGTFLLGFFLLGRLIGQQTPRVSAQPAGEPLRK